MIDYVLLAITAVCTAINIWLALTDRGYSAGYDKGLEDGIRATNEAYLDEEDERQRFADLWLLGAEVKEAEE